MSWKLYHMDIFLMSLDFSKSVVDPKPILLQCW
jgi:hypothetical protein